MRNRCMNSIVALGLAAVGFSSITFAQTAQQSGAAKSAASAPAPPRDLSGVWLIQRGGGGESPVPEKDMPSMTPWAQARFDAERPGYGTRAAPGGNDPILQCDPMGMPRIIFIITPFAFAQIPGGMLQFFERERVWRQIWTDGRRLSEEGQPMWYGNAVGKWDGDYTFVVDSNSYNDKTWLGATGYPHSDEMQIHESYQRVDHDTILYNITINDPKAYTKPVVGPQRTLKLQKANVTLGEFICAASEENAFSERIRAPAAVGQSKK